MSNQFIPGQPIVGQSDAFDAGFTRAMLERNMNGGPGGYAYLQQKYFSAVPEPQQAPVVPAPQPMPQQPNPGQLDVSMVRGIVESVIPIQQPPASPTPPPVNDQILPQPTNDTALPMDENDLLQRIMGGQNPNTPVTTPQEPVVNPNVQQPIDVQKREMLINDITQSCTKHGLTPDELLRFASNITFDDIGAMAKMALHGSGAAPVQQPPSVPQYPQQTPQPVPQPAPQPVQPINLSEQIIQQQPNVSVGGVNVHPAVAKQWL